MHVRRFTLLAVATAGVALAPAAAAQAQVTLAVEQQAAPVAAFHGTVMWSHFDAGTATYSLMLSQDGGTPQLVPVAPRSAPFDIDLGSNRGGSTYAVYTRCADGDTGCDIYRLRPSSGVEEHITKLSSPTADERDPTISGGNIGFIRRDGGKDQLRYGTTISSSKGSKLIVSRPSILSAELGDLTHVSYVEATKDSEFGAQKVHVRNLSTGRDQIVYTARSGGANTARVTKPSFMEIPNAFLWARTNNGTGTGNRLVRYTLRGSKLAYAQGSSRWTSTAWASDKLGAAVSSAVDVTGCKFNDNAPDSASICAVQLTGPVTFDLRP
jgi:hypothetical protein